MHKDVLLKYLCCTLCKFLEVLSLICINVHILKGEGEGERISILFIYLFIEFLCINWFTTLYFVSVLVSNSWLLCKYIQ